MAKTGSKRQSVQRSAGSRLGARESVWFSLVLPMLLTVLMIASLPTFVLLFFGMLPTIVALITDRSEGRYAVVCVGGMNFAGVLPFLLDLWFGAPSLHAARLVITDVFAMAAMYGAAALGWLLFMGIPPVVSSVRQAMAQRRVELLRSRQDRLIEEWGDSVANPLEKLEAESSPTPERARRAPSGASLGTEVTGVRRSQATGG